MRFTDLRTLNMSKKRKKKEYELFFELLDANTKEKISLYNDIRSIAQNLDTTEDEVRNKWQTGDILQEKFLVRAVDLCPEH